MDWVRRTAGLDVLPSEFTYSINISKLWGQLNEPSESEITDPITGETHTKMSNHKRYEGSWNFTIPITIDRSGTQVKEIMEANEYSVIITDADGKVLDYQGMFAEVYSLYGRNTDTVHIYVMEFMTGFEYTGDKAYLLPEKALFQTTVTW